MVRKTYVSRSERNRAYYCRNNNIPYQLVEGCVVRLDRLPGKTTIQTQPINDIIAEIQEKEPTLENTINWSWPKWNDKYQRGSVFLEHQLKNQILMDRYNRGTIRDPRQHGKTNFVLKKRILRHMCETPFTGSRNILYGSHSNRNSIFMTMALKYELIMNPAIIDNYGMLIDFETYKQSRLKKQTQNIINLLGQPRESHSFQGISTGQGIRGTSGIDETYIDDPIDLEKEEEYAAATEKFLNWLKYKIMPFCRGGDMWFIGTRYGIRDLYTFLDDEKLYFNVERSAVEKIYPYTINYPETEYETHFRETFSWGEYELITSYLRNLQATDIVTENESQWKLLASELWENAYNGSTVQNIMYEMVSLGERATQQELMNNPLPINPLIKWEWLHEYERMPYPYWTYRWAIFVDVGAGESKAASYTAMVLVGEKDNKYFIYDIIWGKWTGKEKQEKLEKFISDKASEFGRKVSERDFRVLIETVLSQRDFFQRIRDESWITPKPISPAKRRDKETRITHGLGQDMENGLVYIYRFINPQNKRQFQMEVNGFPKYKEDHILDATDQCIYYLKKFKRDPRVKAGWLR